MHSALIGFRRTELALTLIIEVHEQEAFLAKTVPVSDSSSDNTEEVKELIGQNPSEMRYWSLRLIYSFIAHVSATMEKCDEDLSKLLNRKADKAELGEHLVEDFERLLKERKFLEGYENRRH